MIISTLLVTGGALSIVTAGAACAGGKVRQYRSQQLKSFLVPVPHRPEPAELWPQRLTVRPLLDRLTAPESFARDLVITGTTGAAALMHLRLGLIFEIPIQILNGLGYTGFLIARFVPQLTRYQSVIRYGLLGYAVTTVTAYFVINGAGGLLFGFGMMTKLIEAVLIVLLWCETQLQGERFLPNSPLLEAIRV